MSKNKLAKFAELEAFPNVFQNFTPLQPALTTCGNKVDYKGRWNEAYFAQPQDLVLELACGKGDYTVNLAKQFPEKNFIGVDVKGNRLWTGAKTALDEGLSNVAFVRTRIEQLALFFGPEEISEIWITFPDPFPRKSRALKRLTSPRFLNIYREICRPGALIHLKTDAENLFDYTLEVLEEERIEPKEVIRDVHGMPDIPPELQILTYYEKMHLAAGKKIQYLSFQLNS